MLGTNKVIFQIKFIRITKTKALSGPGAPEWTKSFRASIQRNRCFKNIFEDRSTKDYPLLTFQNFHFRFFGYD